MKSEPCDNIEALEQFLSALPDCNVTSSANGCKQYKYPSGLVVNVWRTNKFQFQNDHLDTDGLIERIRNFNKTI